MSSPSDGHWLSSKGATEPPFVSIIMPIRNERDFIEKSLGSVLRQDYPQDRLEIIVADGMSDDGTRDAIRALATDHPRLILIDNPGRIVPTGLNAGIAQARGEIILRIDGHALVASDFVRQNVSLLEEHPEAWAVGGPIAHEGRTRFAKAVALAMSHPLGVGMAAHHFPEYEGYVDGAAFPAVRRWVFDRIGFFDEDLVRNQDDEFSYRIGQAGGKCYVSPRVKSLYYVRETPKKLFRQYWQYSFWRIPVIRKHRRPTTVRQVIPPLFFLTMIVLLAAGWISGRPWLALAMPAVYALALTVVGLAKVPKAGLKVGLLVPLAIATMHAAYASGMSYGLVAMVLRPRAWDRTGGMATLNR